MMLSYRIIHRHSHAMPCPLTTIGHLIGTSGTNVWISLHNNIYFTLCNFLIFIFIFMFWIQTGHIDFLFHFVSYRIDWDRPKIFHYIWYHFSWISNFLSTWILDKFAFCISFPCDGDGDCSTNTGIFHEKRIWSKWHALGITIETFPTGRCFCIVLDGYSVVRILCA